MSILYIAMIALLVLAALFVIAMTFGKSRSSGWLMLVFILTLLGAASYTVYEEEFQNEHWATCTIKSTVPGPDDGYLITTDECNVLKNATMYLRASKEDVNKLQVKLERSKTFKMLLAGSSDGIPYIVRIEE